MIFEKLQLITPILEARLKTVVLNIYPLTGGDINDVFLIEYETGKFVIKINSAYTYPKMFEAEKTGLEILRNSNTIQIPEVYFTETVNDISFIVLEYIEQGNRKKDFWKKFGTQLAALHKTSSDNFGFYSSNYIGSLVQSNDRKNSAMDFYISQRLEPQFKLAFNNGYIFKNRGAFYKNIETVIPNEKPSLIHGDLWMGNYLVSDKGDPCLIDPSVSYSFREMDIAMMHLFGGFEDLLFHVYNEIFPLEKNWKNRMDVWQLYYLLVHLNLFGSSYFGRVQQILKKYC
ncbi:fructosamine kinase family protein [Abyssalbus ytuae]|uniref:Fructosamine kinase family protein n=1 Tax=Abyssalbus ytuae TaxID=2926907 RepID=A0A9E6ZXS6_9FLAO|nr:fructosamine kinase family protein [Abyssalbus ytuae]UOB18871.1 fructosamine kinase family protein [Abyssalbus ytuae]